MMEIEVTKQNDAPLLSRKRVTAFVNFAATTPSRLELKFALGTQLKVNPDLVIIKHIYQRFGARRAKLIAHVYDKKELLEKLESEGLVAKHFKKVVEKKEEQEAPAKVEEAPKAEAPAEKKEEAPAKEKKEEKAEEAPAEKSE
jgi:ribosomal protein S24E